MRCAWTITILQGELSEHKQLLLGAGPGAGAAAGAAAALGAADAGAGAAAQDVGALLAEAAPLADRNSVLLCSRKDFSPVLQLLSSLRREDDAAERRRAEEARRERAERAAREARQGNRFERDTKGALAGQLGDHGGTMQKLGIDMSAGGGLMYGGSGKDAAKSSSKAERDQQKRRAAAHEAQRRGRDKDRERSRSKSEGRRKSSGSGKAGGAQQQRKGRGIPIIIVPPGFSSLINMYNAKGFLQDSQFETWQASKERMDAQGVGRDNIVILQRTHLRESPVVYHVVDNANAISGKDWARVVAVFTQGASWQFREFPYKDTVDVFQHVRGFHLRFEEEPKVPESVRGWDVKVLWISRNNRHKDRTAAMQFWEALDQFLASNRSTLAY